MSCQICGKSGILHSNFNRNGPLLSFTHLGSNTNNVSKHIADGDVYSGAHDLRENHGGDRVKGIKGREQGEEKCANI